MGDLKRFGAYQISHQAPAQFHEARTDRGHPCRHRALEATLAGLDELGVDRILCAGDLVGYGSEPDAAVALLRDRASPASAATTIAGPSSGGKCSACAAGSRPSSATTPGSSSSACPPADASSCDGRILAVHHGSPASDTEYVTPYKPLPASVEQFWDRSDAHV